MKRKLLRAAITLSALLFSSLTLAAQIGPYFGGSVGRSSARVPNTNPFDVIANGGGSTSLSRTGWAERAFIGYNVNKFFGLEAGYTNYARALYNARSVGDFSQMQYNFRTWDAEFKAYLPIGYTGFNFYVLAGAAYVKEILNFTNGNIPLSGSIALPLGAKTHGYSTRPYYGFGANVTVIHHVTFNVEATQIMNIRHFSDNANAIPYLNMASLGIAYNFC